MELKTGNWQSKCLSLSNTTFFGITLVVSMLKIHNRNDAPNYEKNFSLIRFAIFTDCACRRESCPGRADKRANN